MRTHSLFWIIFLFTITNTSAYALRCGTKLISKGDYKLNVRHICGEPDDIYHRTISHHSDCVPTHHHNCVSATLAVNIEEWIYNFGPRHFMRKLSFENGELQSIETLGYGF